MPCRRHVCNMPIIEIYYPRESVKVSGLARTWSPATIVRSSSREGVPYGKWWFLYPPFGEYTPLVLMHKQRLIFLKVNAGLQPRRKLIAEGKKHGHRHHQQCIRHDRVPPSIIIQEEIVEDTGLLIPVPESEHKQ